MRRLTHFFIAPIFGFLLAGLLLFACKSKPVPPISGISEAIPSASLIFKGVEAEEPSYVSLLFTLEIINPSPYAGRVKIESWRAEVNGRETASGLSLESGGNAASDLNIAVRSHASASLTVPLTVPLKLNMDMTALSAEGLAPLDNYKVNLIIGLGLFIEGKTESETENKTDDDLFPPIRFEVSSLAEFPGVRAPEFNITSIAIIKAELINTRFRVTMKIDNPNSFPMGLSAFGYALYGNGRLWADGNEKNIFTVPAKSSAAAELYLLMNFINMDRNLLNQIINLVDVNYRFTGEAQVSTGVEYLPRFSTGFDLSGYSQVLEK